MYIGKTPKGYVKNDLKIKLTFISLTRVIYTVQKKKNFSLLLIVCPKLDFADVAFCINDHL